MVETGIVRAWVDGWVVSRGTAPPQEEPWGLSVDVGLPRQVTRHVLFEADEPLVRKLTETLTAPGSWIKLFLEPEVVEPWIAPGWTFDSPGWLMSAVLRPSSVGVPDGYRVRTWTQGGVTRVLVRTADGCFAARGQVTVVPGSRTGSAVIDQVETDPAHRRKGLGRLVMGTLANAAAEAGASTGVLGATVDGRALYESLGWRIHGPLTGLIRPAPGAV